MSLRFSLKREWPMILLLIISFVAGAYFYAHFPDRVVTHWGFNGEPNGWSGRFTAAFIIPILLVGMYLLFWFIPFIDPKRERYESFKHVYDLFRTLIIALLFVIYMAASLYNLGYNVAIKSIVPVLVGLLLIVIGNYMGKLKMNWFVGVRTPWALSSEEVWNKTNRFGGRMMVLFGVIILLTPLLPTTLEIILFIAGAILATVGSFVYSYLVYRKERKV